MIKRSLQRQKYEAERRIRASLFPAAVYSSDICLISETQYRWASDFKSDDDLYSNTFENEGSSFKIKGKHTNSVKKYFFTPHVARALYRNI